VLGSKPVYDQPAEFEFKETMLMLEVTGLVRKYSILVLGKMEFV
jgi:hypothetical protein